LGTISTFQKVISECPTFSLFIHRFIHTPSINNTYLFDKTATDNDFMDSDDDDLLAKETLGDKVNNESFLSMVDNASEGGDFLKILNFLPNLLQQYGHSLTMNAIIKDSMPSSHS
jgi:hypothetical protein